MTCMFVFKHINIKALGLISEFEFFSRGFQGGIFIRLSQYQEFLRENNVRGHNIL